MRFDFTEKKEPVQKSLFDKNVDNPDITEENVEESELEIIKGRYQFAKRLYTGSKAMNASNLLIAIDIVLDFIELKNNRVSYDELVEKYNEFLGELKLLFKTETTRNGTFSIALACHDIEEILGL